MDSADFNTGLVEEILASQAPDWAAQPIKALESPGTDNALFMLGHEHVVRIPKFQAAAPLLEKELTWLPKLKGLPLTVPEIVHRATAKRPFKFDFGIYRWIKGETASPDAIQNTDVCAASLAEFLLALAEVDTGGAPRAGVLNNNRGINLVNLSQKVSDSIAILADEIDVTKAHALWDRACSARPSMRAVWVHGDLKASNLIARDGILIGVIDWGLSAVGDPAVDYAAAWSWVDPGSRQLFRQACRIEEDDWRRAQGWALYSAAIALSYYRGRSHEELCEQSRLTLSRLGLLT